VRIAVQHVDGLRFLAMIGRHTAALDAAPEDGGAGTAPSAPQLFVATMGACILEFVANSCRLHEIPFERLSLEVECEELARPRRLSAMAATIHIEPEPPEDVKRRLVGVARHSTLVNTLVRPPEVVVRFAEERGESDADL
jgi:hypothetical protein